MNASNISSLSGAVTSLQGLSHDAVTVGTGNGLSLSGQQVSLGLASSSTTGSLAYTDWNAFNTKLGWVNVSNGLYAAGTSVNLRLASSTTTGALSMGDWNTFFGKENALNFAG